MAIVYRHITKDNGVVFYIGISNKESRAFDKRSRNKHWKAVVKKHGLNVEITHKDILWEEACVIEKYLISFYGRKDYNNGTLVNMTDGGEGTINKSIESINQQLNTAKSNGTYKQMCDRMIYYGSMINKSGINSNVRKEAYAYDISGKYIGHFITYTTLAAKINSSVSCISKRINTGRQIKGYFVYNEFKGETLSKNNYTISNLSERGRNNVSKNSIHLYNKEENSVIHFGTYKEASFFVGKNRAYISNLISKNKFSFDNYKIILNWPLNTA